MNTFDFKHKKATQALNYFAKKAGGRISRLKAVKLVYFADRYHLRRYGRLVTGDSYFAFPYGPIPSVTLDIAEDSNDIPEVNYSRGYIKPVSEYDYESIKNIDTVCFSETDVEALKFAWDSFGSFGDEKGFELAKLTHEYPEWKRFEAEFKTDSEKRFEMKLEDFFENPKKLAKKFGQDKFTEDPGLLAFSRDIFKENREVGELLNA